MEVLFIFLIIEMTPTQPHILNIKRIGLVHGHQILPWGDHLSLESFRRKLNVDILLSGHTHKNEVAEHNGFYHINPVSEALDRYFDFSYDNMVVCDTNNTFIIFIKLFCKGSITGAYSSLVEKIVPSFILLAIQGSNVVCYVYELIDGELEVSKTDFVKNVTL
jgi:vacuolar protein sorting-associated protein 29